MPVDDAALVRLELETLWVTDDRGRIVRSRDEGVPFEPLLVVAGHRDGCVWATSAVVPDDVDRAVSASLGSAGGSAGGSDTVGWAPGTADELVALLAAAPDVGRLAPPMGGPSWVVPRATAGLRSAALPPAATIRTSVETDLDELRGRMPEEDRELRDPWVVALVGGQVASVCETARSAPVAVEAGVWTYDPHRRQGLGAAVTATWRELVADRTAFYSTSWDNVASQGVARRLDLRPLGQWWQLFRWEGP